MSYAVRLTIAGISPMLQNRMAMPTADADEAKRKSGEEDYAEEWRDRSYVDKKIGYYIPADWFYGLLPKAGTEFQIKGRGKKTYKDFLKAAVVVDDEMIPLGKKKPDTIDQRYVTINRSRVLRLRPRFEAGWRVTLTLTVLDDQLKPAILEEIIRHAGTRVGIGDFRPRFGRFVIEKFEIIKRKRVA